MTDARQLALKALYAGPSTFHILPNGENCTCSQCDFVRVRKVAIAALKADIEKDQKMNANQIALEALKLAMSIIGYGKEHDQIADAIAALEADMQKNAEPVARVDDLERGGRVRALALGLGLDAALYAAPQQAAINAELLEALQEIVDGCYPSATCAKARAAIAKATGELSKRKTDGNLVQAVAALRRAVRTGWLTGIEDWRRLYDPELLALLECKHFQDLYNDVPLPILKEHITDGSPCWCYPETNYTDPDTGVSVIVHKEQS